MSLSKTKIVAAAAVGALLVCATVAWIILTPGWISGSSLSSRTAEVPFRFDHRSLGSGQGAFPSDVDPGGLRDFSSNIPVIVLTSERPGRVSTSKIYSAYEMDIYLPSKGKPAQLGEPPVVTTRIGLRLHGMVSRIFPKLSYRLKIWHAAGSAAKLPGSKAAPAGNASPCRLGTARAMAG